MTEHGKYNVSDTKIGYELETQSLTFTDSHVDSAQNCPNPKSQVLYVFEETGSDGHKSYKRKAELELSDITSDLIATAERNGGNNQIRLELIYGGATGTLLTDVKDMSKKFGFRVVEYMAKWEHLKNPATIAIQPGPNPGDHKGVVPNSPKNVGYKVSKRESPGFMVHMTVGMPLAGFYLILSRPADLQRFFDDMKPSVNVEETTKLFKEWIDKYNSKKDEEKNEEKHKGKHEAKHGAKHEEEEDKIWKIPTYSPDYGRATALGFLLTVQSYISVASNCEVEDNNLKNKVPFMPRTDFRTMFNIVCDTMQTEAANQFRQDLATFFQYPNNDIGTATWSFREKQPVEGGKVEEGKEGKEGKEEREKRERAEKDAKFREENMKIRAAALTQMFRTEKKAPPLSAIKNTMGEIIAVKVEKFLDDLRDPADPTQPDLLTKGDRNRNSQIGGLGNKVERILAHSASAKGKASQDLVGPIVEFRSLRAVGLADLSGQAGDLLKPNAKVRYNPATTSVLQTLEDEVRKIHKEAYDLNGHA